MKKFIPKFLISWYHFCCVYLGAFIYGFPAKKMVIIGVAGTRGKTTTANLIWSILEAAGFKAGLTGTANIRIGREESLNQYHMTMPGRFILQKILSKMVASGCTHAVVETPSEGVEQWRHKGIVYDVAVLTTLYPEYLEAHNWSYERCLEMHQKIFAELFSHSRKIVNGQSTPKIIVVNADNEDANLFLRFKADKKITYGLKPGADITAYAIAESNPGISFKSKGENYDLALPGAFNVSNALAAIAVTTGLGINEEVIKQGLKSLTAVPGRMEEIKAGQPFKVFVDYAHDKISLEAALAAVNKSRENQRLHSGNNYTLNLLKGYNESKIILVIGAEGGGRDKKKRPLMGEIAAKSADFVVVTNVDPYNDNPKEIIEDIACAAEKFGKVKDKNLFAIEDRRAGISKALSIAQRGDIVLITGKGAEQSLIVGKKRFPWDDRIVTREEIKKFQTSQSF